MYCGQCGSENIEESGSCAVCGAPLLISAGAVTCNSCGASLGENDQYCPTCGSPVAEPVVGTSTVYEADDAFGSMSDDEIDVDTLPDWLRDMAAQRESHSVPVEDQSPEAATPSPDDLPDWLRESGPQPVQDHSPPTFAADPEPIQPPSPASQGVEHQPAEQFSLVSEDDLPEWLRALGEEEEGEAADQESDTGFGPGESRSVAMIYEVPHVSRAWMREARTPDPDAVDEARREFASLNDATGDGEEDYFQSIGQGNYSDEETSEFVPAEQIGAQPEAGSAGFGRIASSSAVRITLLIVLLVVFLSLVVLFVQGL